MATSTTPVLHEPVGETLAASGSVAVSGTYSDGFAQSNTGQLFLGISDGTGTVSAHDASGRLVAGSGTGAIAVNVGFGDLSAILKSLTYTAAAGASADTISFDIWNQAGTETTGAVPVTITGAVTSATRTWTGTASGNWNTAQNWSGGGVPTAGNTVIIPGGTPFSATLANATLTGETIDLAITAQAGPSVTFNNVRLGAGTRVEVTNPTLSLNVASLDTTGTFTVAAGATIMPDSGQTLLLNANGAGAAIVNSGTIDDTEVNFANAGTLTNHGLVESDGDYTAIGGGIAVVNTGTLLATNHGALEIADGDIVSGGVVTLANASLFMGGTFENTHLALSGTDAIILYARNAFGPGSLVSGFARGDQIDFQRNAILIGAGLSFANNTLTLAYNGTIDETIPLAPGYGLGNFEESLGTGIPGAIAYAPNNGNTGQFQWDIKAPASATVAQGGTLGLGSVSISNAASTVLTVSAQDGDLFMNSASGSGTSSISISGTTAQVNADLASLKYVPAAGATADTLLITAGTIVPDAYPLTERWLPVTVTPPPSGPQLAEPASETLAPSATVALAGSYTDGFAAMNPGFLYLDISDGSGTLNATDASGHAVAGSGSHSITGGFSDADLNAVLASLHYTAGAQAGSDVVSFDIWNQQGTETSGATSIAVHTTSGTVALAGLSHT